LSNLILGLITVAVILGAMAAFSGSYIAPQGTLSDSHKLLRQRTGDMARTQLTSVSLSVTTGGARVDWRVRNSGASDLRDFPRWDMIIRYHGSTTTALKVQRLTYTTSNPPSAGQWTVTNIYRDTSNSAEVYDPGIVNPTEEFAVLSAVSPSIAAGSSDSITAAAPNGVSLSVGFTR
jgi:hypothetical protein